MERADRPVPSWHTSICPWLDEFVPEAESPPQVSACQTACANSNDVGFSTAASCPAYLLRPDSSETDDVGYGVGTCDTDTYTSYCFLLSSSSSDVHSAIQVVLRSSH